jgi:hypothetical protein
MRALSVGALTLAALSALHLTWATGSTWPMGSEAELADNVSGVQQMPSSQACLVMGGGLGLAAAAVAGAGGSNRLLRFVRAGIAVGFLTRGVAGVTGNTVRLVRWKPSAHFVEMDRRYYGPLCLLIGVAAAESIPGPPR